MNPFKLIGLLLLLQLANVDAAAQKELRKEWVIGSGKSKMIFVDTSVITVFLNNLDSTFPHII
jgi:hypothetical protein